MTLFRPIWTDVGLCFIYNSGETRLEATETGTFTVVDLMHFTEAVVPPYRPNRSCMEHIQVLLYGTTISDPKITITSSLILQKPHSM